MELSEKELTPTQSPTSPEINGNRPITGADCQLTGTDSQITDTEDSRMSCCSESFDESFSDPAMFQITQGRNVHEQTPKSPVELDNRDRGGHIIPNGIIGMNLSLDNDRNHVKEEKIDNKPQLELRSLRNRFIPVVGLRNEAVINVFQSNNPKQKLFTKMIKIEAVNEQEKIIVQLKPSRRGIRVLYWPKHIGNCVFTAYSKACIQASFSIEIAGNNPVLSFSEEIDWPVAVGVRLDDSSIYVTFMHHVSKYNSEGEYSREMVRDNSVYFNDIAVDQIRHKMAVSMSGWRKTGTNKFRYQSIRLYSFTGTLLWTVGSQHPLFGVSIMRIAFDLRGNLIVASKGALCTCHRSTGVVERRVEAKFGTASRIAMMEDGHLVIADGNQGHIYVFDSAFAPKNDFKVQLDKNGINHESSVVGLTGLAVDHFGHILVSDCLTSSIQVYSLDGTLLVVIDSEWDFVKWPLALAVTKDGHLFVADHGNACVKKFRYM